MRLLAVSGIKYLILGLVFASYGTVFRDVNGMFDSVANFIYNSTGVGDVFSNWMSQLAQYWQSNGNTSLWNLVTGLASGVISLWLIMGAFVIFPVCYLIFTIFYAMYGSVLYVTGPFVLALLPSRGLGQLSRTYLMNLMTFEAWSLIYAILQVLMSAVNLSSIDAVLNSNGVLNSFVGSSQMVLLALTASIFSFSIMLIPFIASRIVHGDVGSTMMTLVSAMTSTASAVAGMAAASFVGAGEGAMAAVSGGAAPAASPAANGSSVAALRDSATSTSSSSSTAALGASSTSPALGYGGSPVQTSAADSSDRGSSASPWRASSQPGQYRGFNGPHAVAWYVGYSLGSAYRGLKGAA